jgi:hypothetical protein
MDNLCYLGLLHASIKHHTAAERQLASWRTADCGIPTSREKKMDLLWANKRANTWFGRRGADFYFFHHQDPNITKAGTMKPPTLYYFTQIYIIINEAAPVVCICVYSNFLSL